MTRFREAIKFLMETHLSLVPVGRLAASAAYYMWSFVCRASLRLTEEHKHRAVMYSLRFLFKEASLCMLIAESCAVPTVYVIPAGCLLTEESSLSPTIPYIKEAVTMLSGARAIPRSAKVKLPPHSYLGFVPKFCV